VDAVDEADDDVEDVVPVFDDAGAVEV